MLNNINFQRMQAKICMVWLLCVMMLSCKGISECKLSNESMRGEVLCSKKQHVVKKDIKRNERYEKLEEAYKKLLNDWSSIDSEQREKELKRMLDEGNVNWNKSISGVMMGSNLVMLQREGDGKNILQIALEQGCGKELMKYLVEKGGEKLIMQQQAHQPGNNSLHTALLSDCNLEVIKFLVEKGGNRVVRLPNSNNLNALQIVLDFENEQDSKDIIKYLAEKGQQYAVKHKDNDGWNSLQYALYKDFGEDVIECLVRVGGQKFVENQDEDTKALLGNVVKNWRQLF